MMHSGAVKRLRERELRIRQQFLAKGVDLPKLTRREVNALLECDESRRAQKVVGTIIERETAIIQSTWSDAERLKRGGHSMDWTPPVVSSFGLQQDDDNGEI